MKLELALSPKVSQVIATSHSQPAPPPFSGQKSYLFSSDAPWPAPEYLKIPQEFHAALNEEILVGHWGLLGLRKYWKSILETMVKTEMARMPILMFSMCRNRQQ